MSCDFLKLRPLHQPCGLPPPPEGEELDCLCVALCQRVRLTRFAAARNDDGMDTESGHDDFATGGCACGAVRYSLAIAPYSVNCCHCTDCQRQSGSAFGLNAVIETEHVRASGPELLTDQAPSGSGAGQTICRCPQCRTVVWSHYAVMGPRVTFVRVGTLDQPALCPPTVHIFTRSKLYWLPLDPAVPAFAAFYAGRDIPALLGEAGAARLRALRAG